MYVLMNSSTLVEALTGIKPIKFDSELRRNITIKLGINFFGNMLISSGYAGFKVFKCAKCPDPECYQSAKSNAKEAKCKVCSSKMELIRHFAFVDCPGHDMLIATLLNGAAVMVSTHLKFLLMNAGCCAPPSCSKPARTSTPNCGTLSGSFHHELTKYDSSSGKRYFPQCNISLEQTRLDR